MAKRKVVSEIYSYGVYSRWETGAKALPKIVEITNTVLIEPNVEFGMVLKVKGAKGKLLKYRIDHPSMVDELGELLPPFEGDYFVNSNEYDFFLGDTVWEPYGQMAGEWVLSTWCDGKLLAQKKIRLEMP